MTPKVKSLMKKRNTGFLRKQITTHRKEWIEACREVNQARNEAKQEKWVQVLSSALEDTDERGIWKLVKSLNGSPDTNSPNAAMTIKGVKITSAKKKADAFVKHYAAVSRLKFDKIERRIIRHQKTMIRSKKHLAAATPFTMEELKASISKMRRKGAPGPDDIHSCLSQGAWPISSLIIACNL